MLASPQHLVFSAHSRKAYVYIPMPENLRAVHAKNDAAVLAVYGQPLTASDMEILPLRFTRYAELIGKDSAETRRCLEQHRPVRRRMRRW